MQNEPINLPDDEMDLAERCPRCNVYYDEIDFEYQICHHCNYDNEQKVYKVKLPRQAAPVIPNQIHLNI